MRIIPAVLLAIVTAIAGCGGGGDSGTGPSPTQTTQGLEGTWKATKAEFVSTSNSSLRTDIVSTGSTVSLVLAAGTFTLTMTDPGESPNVTTGTWSASRDVVTMTPTGMSWSWTFDMGLSGNTLTLGGAAVEFDFNADGHNEQARLNLVLARQ